MPAGSSRGRAGGSVAIVPARGGSRGIPRKNARLLAGRPLLAYSLETALASREIDRVFLSTEDRELAEIARRMDVPVLARPPELAADDVALDAVVVDAVRQLEQTGLRFDTVVTLQTTSPLLRPESVDEAVRKHRREALDTVVSVMDDTHLRWGEDADGQPTPLYAARVNRQWLPRHFRETGGVVVARRAVLDAGSRFGPRVGVLEVSRREAVDIDDYADWWLVEKYLQRRRIVFHVTGSRATGLGHVTRALSLADRLIDYDVAFLVSRESDLAAEMIRRRFYPVTLVEPGSEWDALRAEGPDLVVNDVLDTPAEPVRALRAAGIRSFHFEDLGPGSLEADFVVNAMYDAHPERGDRAILQGADCCCLRDEFHAVEPSPLRDKVERVLVLFGGTDPGDLTLRSLRWLDARPEPFAITVVVGLGHPHPDEVQTFAEDARHPVDVVLDTPVISRFMLEADLALTSAGRTVFELGSLGVPMLVLAQNDRELSHVFARSSPGVVFLGRGDRLAPEAFDDAVGQLLASRLLRQKMREALLSSGLRQGIDRVLSALRDVLAAGA